MEGNGKILGRDFNFAAKRGTVVVPCPELECSIILRELSLAQLKEVDKDDTAAQLALMIVDESGERVFKTAEDMANLNGMSASISTRLLKAAAKLNGVSVEAIEEAVKKSMASQSTASASA